MYDNVRMRALCMQHRALRVNFNEDNLLSLMASPKAVTAICDSTQVFSVAKELRVIYRCLAIPFAHAHFSALKTSCGTSSKKKFAR